ncbi:MAG: MarR family winged helix-turn-helix transcriptional regulator [Candidatus Nanopelagicales bacterium]|nr:MarR family winged helix-turn-helix transcriptional regulator [Candidatus Nanopelagicales bacterium]
MSDSWQPECAEDELLVAFVAVKRAFVARSLGGDPGVFPILHHLAVAGPSRQGALAEAIGLDASTVSRHVRALVVDGFVATARDPEDGRATVLTLTDAGREHLVARLRANRATLRAATEDFTAAERAELVRLLHKLVARLGDLEETA